MDMVSHDIVTTKINACNPHPVHDFLRVHGDIVEKVIFTVNAMPRYL